jgi:transcriptional/translational regulatory protein YebC/TACO1
MSGEYMEQARAGLLLGLDRLDPAVRSALDAAGIAIESGELTQVPKSTIRIEGAEARKVLNLIDDLEDLDDVQDVYSNFDIPDDVLAALAT